MDSNQAVIAAALRAYDPEMPAAQAEHAARLTAAALDNVGYAVVKLPDMVVDEDGFKTWPVDSNGRDAHVWSLAAALLAAHRYVGEEATDAA